MKVLLSAATGLLLGLAALLLGGGGANAAPLSKLDIDAPTGGLVHQVNSGCGWDYPCRPRPDYGRRVSINNNYQRAKTQFNIQNYGRVHINYYAGNHYRPRHRPRYRKHVRRHYNGCHNGDCRGHCGPHCWYRKFKSGHCGHGCQFYRERVRFENEYREVKVRRPVYYKAPRHEYSDFPSRDYDDRPRRRIGYPQCDDDDC
jgi:hypothetical protein